MSNDELNDQTDLDWERRVLCSDESCIGTIGPDGMCRECGKPYEGEFPESFGSDGTAAQDSEEQLLDIEPGSEALGNGDDPGEGHAAPEEAIESSVDHDDEWARRTLCSDEACIGTIGPDGFCKECGKPYEG